MCLVRSHINMSVQDMTHPPSNLLSHVEAMLVSTLRQDLLFVRVCWSALSLTIWSFKVFTPSMEEIETLNGHGLSSFGDLYPPTRVCLTTGCPNHRSCNNVATLSNPVAYKAVRYSLQYGVLPIHVTSTYCHRCLHQYHHNYVVCKVDDARVYYGGVPEVIQVATHFFIDSQVLEMFATAKVFGW
ncbi:hypothetical protein PAXRUDRAFT_174302 [Paxillus rubicundulus Ve08.2h10]|uniref:CxC5 like cysteine cluster associated with KDZ domain-containing protein n=1 Tax=Paxillus rubicundulus Ve08.2h10 TaxID=930991 RepID=A0A0D0CV08_9AGAM|nr:hypothetical protein PAXRUDRAFT_174302 [Paxillus rubicundulus Ve08.2h10]